jgi:endonuclease G
MFLMAPLACQGGKPPPGTEPGSTQAPQAESPDPNIRFGMPAPATADPSNREAYLISRKQYVLSYNDKTHNPNWVCLRLTKDDIGKAKRGAFQPDPLLPRGFGKVTAHTYDGSGFDRGHQCAAQDRSATQEDMDATFFTTNIVPQAPHCNHYVVEFIM